MRRRWIGVLFVLLLAACTEGGSGVNKPDIEDSGANGSFADGNLDWLDETVTTNDVQASGGDAAENIDLGTVPCIRSSECPAGLRCVNYLCGECMFDEDCGPGMRCSSFSTYSLHYCFPLKCQTDGDCAPWRCGPNGTCVQCVSDDDCEAPLRCRDTGWCGLPECKTDADCPKGSRCSNGRCIQCITSADCPEERYCDDSLGLCLLDNCEAGSRKCIGPKEGWSCSPDGKKPLYFYCFAEWQTCQEGKCVGEKPVCKSDCGNRECGFDSCGRLCGSCKKGEYCDGGTCKPLPKECTPRKTPGCEDCLCEAAVCNKMPDCCETEWSEHCVWECEKAEPGLECPRCIAHGVCTSRFCGMEPCGSFCGPCEGGGYCDNGVCTAGTPVDFGRPCRGPGECLSGYCKQFGGVEAVCTVGCKSDSDCPVGWSCSGEWCQPKPTCGGSCSGLACGPDLCGGSCGECEAGKMCTLHNQCKVPSNGCEPSDVPTCGGCPCQECVCSIRPECCLLEWSFDCVLICEGLCDPKDEMQKLCNWGSNPCKDKQCGVVETVLGYWNCGTCPKGYECIDYKCKCKPNCEGRYCGSDGCGGTCGNPSPPVECFPSVPSLVTCVDGLWSWVPLACHPSAMPGPDCFPSKEPCMDRDCICMAMPACCDSLWTSECVQLAKAKCGLDCTPRPCEVQVSSR